MNVRSRQGSARWMGKKSNFDGAKRSWVNIENVMLCTVLATCRCCTSTCTCTCTTQTYERGRGTKPTYSI